MKSPFQRITIFAGAAVIIIIALLLFSNSTTRFAQGQTTGPNYPAESQTTRNKITDIQSQIDKLSQRVADLERSRLGADHTRTMPQNQSVSQNNSYSNYFNQKYSTTTPINIPSTVTVAPGSYVDFIGKSFGVEEDVQVIQNGQIIRTARADGGGNFSTGAIQVSSARGTILYTFRGVNSGVTKSATIIVKNVF